MTGEPAAFAVIADGHAGLDEQSTAIYSNRENAVAWADTANADAESAGVPLHHRVFALRELDDTEMWDWGLRHADGRVLRYVNERAARDSLYDRVSLVRRRAGATEWEDAR